MQEHKAKGYTKKKRLFYCDIYDMDPLLTAMTEANLGILHRCDEGCTDAPLAAEVVSWSSQTSARVGQSQKFPYHLVYTFNKSLVLISTITNPHIKGIIILVYKCFNDKK